MPLKLLAAPLWAKGMAASTTATAFAEAPDQPDVGEASGMAGSSLAQLRNAVFKDASMDSAKEWGEKLGDFQQRCFEDGDPESCKAVSEEMTQASNLFQDLAASTKATAQEALLKAGTGAAKIAGFGWASLPAIALATQPQPMAIQMAPPPTSTNDFL